MAYRLHTRTATDLTKRNISRCGVLSFNAYLSVSVTFKNLVCASTDQLWPVLQQTRGSLLLVTPRCSTSQCPSSTLCGRSAFRIAAVRRTPITSQWNAPKRSLATSPNRPDAEVRCVSIAVAGKAAPLRNLPDRQFVLIGQTGRCPEAGNQTAISRFPAVQRWMVANGSFSVQRMRTPDPIRTFVAPEVQRQVTDCCGRSKLRLNANSSAFAAVG